MRGLPLSFIVLEKKEKKERKIKGRLIFRWSVFWVCIFLLLWGIWFIVTGKAPVINEIKIAKEYSLNLPFGLYRWTDILVVAIWPILLTLIFRSKKILEGENSQGDNFPFGFSIANIVLGFIVGLILNVWVIFGSLWSLIPSLIILAVMSLINYGVAHYKGEDYKHDFSAILVLNLLFSLGVSLGIVISVSLIIGLIFGLISFLILLFLQYCLVHFIRSICLWLAAATKVE